MLKYLVNAYQSLSPKTQVLLRGLAWAGIMALASGIHRAFTGRPHNLQEWMDAIATAGASAGAVMAAYVKSHPELYTDLFVKEDKKEYQDADGGKTTLTHTETLTVLNPPAPTSEPSSDQ